MAFDGIVISNIVDQLNKTIKNGRLYKIAQPENDELFLTVKTSEGQYRLLLSANPTLPLCYLAKDNKTSPIKAPNFCMLLRKHLNNGRIISITQPEFERIIDIEIEHLDELGDLCRKHLITEFMGKHSNIILVNEDNMILDSIRHVSAQMSSVREVLPGRPYFITNTNNKLNPVATTKDEFFENVFSKAQPISKAIYQTYTGFSSLAGEELCIRAKIDSQLPANCLENADKEAIFDTFSKLLTDIKADNYKPNIVFSNNIPKEFWAFELEMFSGSNKTSDIAISNYESISDLIRDFYKKKEIYTRIHQKSADLRRIVTTILERDIKKLDIQERQLKDTEKKEKYKIYGELLSAYSYDVTSGDESYTCNNYYDNSEITIPLDKDLSAIENANKYFAKYNKLKRTYEATTVLIKEVSADINYLESVLNSLEIAVSEEDLNQIKEELHETGYIKSSKKKNSKKISSKPLHYISSDGFDIYVGKNNSQNDELTFKFANANDWWFHAKQMPGSHVVLRTNGKEVPDRAFEEAAALAAYYSKGRELEKVEIDYVVKKEVKKPAQAKPGYVVYYTNYSLIAKSDISMLKEVED
ncbi:Rqc2 family fibronectin-binding protein [Lachnospira pectinoschiza]|uniref:Rqc2 homolog RqcH n=1 Tax=Lachnospira pectinoschiza TaxID=28052 RepID=A0A1G9VRE0_9FIRM|nr:NFACT RNA binding domain-containing protein [Lachnospira pectinoschiza]SDM74656.1 Predicted component of the ribosome quality control (RQC) complex, YloA/Tae2 family, contains fibronectin-binding (FbpA) and DUF814 domains [Lachnospira pectinoschiza]